MAYSLGVYVMHVASMLSGMHPQTLRKYERAGFLTPSRSNTLRMYSDEDVAHLRMIKRLVDDGGLNLAGVEMVLKMRVKILKTREKLLEDEMSRKLDEPVLGLLDELLEILDLNQSQGKEVNG